MTRSPAEMVELLEALATAADRLELSYSETAYIVREAARLIDRLCCGIDATPRATAD